MFHCFVFQVSELSSVLPVSCWRWIMTVFPR